MPTEADRIRKLELELTSMYDLNSHVGTMCQEQKAELIALREENERLAKDAERWQAFISCARIRIIGSAGFNGPDDYRHFGAEFWTCYPDAKPTEEIKRILIEFADAAIDAAHPMTPEQIEAIHMTDIHAAAEAAKQQSKIDQTNRNRRMEREYDDEDIILIRFAEAILANPTLLLKPPVWVESKPTYWETVWAWDTGVGVAYSIVHREDSPLYSVFGFVVGFDSLEAAQAACWQDYCERMKGAFVERAV